VKARGKETVDDPVYRRIVAELRDCEERYQRLADMSDATDEERLKNALSTLKSEVRQRRRLEVELLKAVEAERERIGQDLHDDLCQRLGGTAMMISVIAARVGQTESATGTKLQQVAKLINDTIESCRALARGLHPVTLATRGLPAALDELAERMPGGIVLRWPHGKRIKLEHETALQLYRITEEAVGNAVRHAEATRIDIALDTIKGATVLVIKDNGKGFARDSVAEGMGLRNMQYRANVIEATLEIGQRKGGGTQVRCRIPGLRPKPKSA
jgi:two-component system sensor kinase FixL